MRGAWWVWVGLLAACAESGQEAPDTDAMVVDTAPDTPDTPDTADTSGGPDGSEVSNETSSGDATAEETRSDGDDAADGDEGDDGDDGDDEDTTSGDTATDGSDSADSSDIAEVSDSGDLSDSNDVVADTAIGPDAVPAGCERFAISPEKGWLEPFGFTVFLALGASGARRFDLPGDVTGSSIHPSLGTFLAGPSSGVVSVRLSDPVCGERFAELVVVEPLTILPAIASIEPSVGTLQFEVIGGSGAHELELRSVDGRTPAATLSPSGRLFAGAIAEDLLVEVEDLNTGRVRVAQVHVRFGSTLVVSPSQLALPVGESWRLAVNGGSGRVDVRLVSGGSTLPDGTPASSPVVAFQDGVLTGLQPGRAALRIEDLHTGEVVPSVVDVVASPSLAMNPAGDGKLTGQLLVADLDGDGLPEALFGVAEADVDAHDGGAVFVHRGVVGGFEVEPALTLSSSGRVDELGSSLAVGDLDGDGFAELVVGVPLSDEGGVDRGAVRIHRGHPELLLEEEPSQTLIGEAAGDQLGAAVALCDFNGDGRLDLAMSARFAEDENQSPVATNAGAVYIHLGQVDGFQRVADQVVFGAFPSADLSTMVPRTNLNLGRAIAVGDIDDDGRCDLVVTSTAYSAGAGRSNDGLFMVYRGRGPDDFGPGGIVARPSLVVVGDEGDAGGQLGLSVAVGDVDGDGLGDVLVGQPEYNRRVGTASRAGNGAAVLWPGRLVPVAGTTVQSVTTAPWRYVGRDTISEAGDRVGYAVAIGDLDGQEPLDIFVGARLDEQVPQCASNCGTVHAIAGRLSEDGPALPSPLMPTRVYPGDRADQNFGSLIAVAPDLDGDGLAEVLTRAGSDNRITPRLGLHALRYSTAETPPMPLAFGYASGGSRHGAALAVVPDLDGDGLAELAVGAWRSQFDPSPTAAHRPGEVALYRGTARGVAEQPFMRLGGFAGHGSSDAFGHAMAMSDLDGDGQVELVVVARTDDTGTACAPARTDSGSVLVFERSASVFSTTPMATFWGPQASQQVSTVATADMNGDGFDDLILGGPLWDRPGFDNVGGVAVHWGGAGLAGNRCTADATIFGVAASDALGTALEPLGDIDGDGCDEVAIGVPQADPPGAANAGAVYVWWGYGASCATAVPTLSAISPLNAGAQAGVSLAAADLDGDGRVELAIGSRIFNNGVEVVGAVWLVTGEQLRALRASAVPHAEGVRPTVVNATPAGREPARLVGTRRNEDFAATLALVPGVGFEDGWLAIGRPLTDLSGVDGAGAVTVHEVRLAGQTFSFRPTPPLAVGGESRRPRADFGRALVGWRVASRPPLLGGRVLAVGAGFSSALGLDDGAFFVTPPR